MQPLLRAIMVLHLRLTQTGLPIVPANIGPSILQAGLISLTTAIATSVNEYCQSLLIGPYPKWVLFLVPYWHGGEG